MINDRQHTDYGILRDLAKQLGADVKNHRVDIPVEYGSGYCTGYVFNKHISMVILNYELYADLLLPNLDSETHGRTILFKFQNIFGEEEGAASNKTPSVLIATRLLDPDVIPIHTNKSTINIEVDAKYLNSLFDDSEKSPVLKGLLHNTQPLLFEQIVYPSLQKVVDEMLTEPVDDAFKLFYLRVKAEELICKLLMELEKRDEQHLYDLNGQDIQMMYKVKNKVLMHLDIPPLINDLAAFAGMSPTKLKRLFKQIFGSSIFYYYQQFRMQKAARLLRNEKLSVAAAGYQLGFTNLSHFARVFQEHMGIKPKAYSRS